MTWMNLLDTLKEQPYETLNREIRFYYRDEENHRCIDFDIEDIMSPYNFPGEYVWEMSEHISEIPLQIELSITNVFELRGHEADDKGDEE